MNLLLKAVKIRASNSALQFAACHNQIATVEYLLRKGSIGRGNANRRSLQAAFKSAAPASAIMDLLLDRQYPLSPTALQDHGILDPAALIDSLLSHLATPIERRTPLFWNQLVEQLCTSHRIRHLVSQAIVEQLKLIDPASQASSFATAAQRRLYCVHALATGPMQSIADNTPATVQSYSGMPDDPPPRRLSMANAELLAKTAQRQAQALIALGEAESMRLVGAIPGILRASSQAVTGRALSVRLCHEAGLPPALADTIALHWQVACAESGTGQADERVIASALLANLGENDILPLIDALPPDHLHRFQLFQHDKVRQLCHRILNPAPL